MRVLIIGGSRFVGRAAVVEALARGASVTTFNRGVSGGGMPGVELVRGDRERQGDVERLAALGPWDVVIDTSGYVPAVTGMAARLLSGRAGHYVFVSTVSVYSGWPKEAVDEDSETFKGDPDVSGTAADEAGWSAAQYGAYKVGCELAVQQRFTGRLTILRPGVILGPGENVGRLTWWLRRIALGGQVVVPAPTDREIQPVDARDVAAFAMDVAECGTEGVFNVTAPIGHATFGEMVEACRQVTQASAEFVWVAPEVLHQVGVREWTELPLWRTPVGTWRVGVSRALEAGLRCRPLAQTVSDTWAWLADGSGPNAYERQAHHGLSAEKEAALLAAAGR
jgi:2'-hydroxyisoflavone reductase